MKYLSTLCFLTLLLFIGSPAVAQKLPWREGEKQVKIDFSTHAQSPEKILGLLRSANTEGYTISYEEGNGFVRCYVTPAEYNFLVTNGLTPETEITDLNAHSQSMGVMGVPPGYSTVAQLNEIADSLATNFPSICSKTLLGYGSFNDPIYALKISDNVAVDENEPELIFEGGIHGDEVGGPENCIRFARDLVLGYGTDDAITYAVDNAETWIVYCINPYGRNSMTRYNANGIDVNRDGGYMWDGEGNSYGAFSQAETKIIRDMVRNHQTVVYISYHSGTEYISYPWSYRADLTPDEANHNYLAQQYAENSGYAAIPYAPGFTGMYAINGSTKDYGYGATGSIAWSVEISNSKQPAASQVIPYYLKNKDAMLSMITNSINQGIHGTITDSLTGEPVVATIFINNLFPVNTNPVAGDYHKFLVPGTYNIRIEANGYLPQEFSNIIITGGSQTTVDAQLTKGGGYYAGSVVACYIPNNNPSDEGYTPSAIGAPDNERYSIGRNGYVVVDMGTAILNRTGNDFMVIEGDQSEEGYQVFASNTPDGPWLYIGTGTSTAAFDLSTSMLLQAQYVKITDDGDGTAMVPDAGFDLDAIENLHPDTLTMGWISGYVYNDQEPYFTIPGAVITVNGNTCTSDLNGYFIIAALPGEVEILGVAPKYQDLDTVVVVLGDTLVHDMHLRLMEHVKNISKPQVFTVSPVPADDQITISGPEGEYTVEIIETGGTCLTKETATLSKTGLTIRTNNLRSGFYICRISNDTYSGMLKMIIR